MKKHKKTKYIKIPIYFYIDKDNKKVYDFEGMTEEFEQKLSELGVSDEYENKLTSAICDIEDVKRSIPKGIKSLPKDYDGTEYTIGECINDVLEFLKELESDNGVSNE